MTRALSAILVCLALTASVEAAARTHKIAVVFANNSGHDSNEDLRYAHGDARKIHRVLTELGGFDPDDSALLLGADAPTVMAALENAQRRISAIREKSTDKTLLLIYYSGHAEGDVLELGRSSLRFDKLRKYLSDSSAHVRIAFLDSCQSGKLISTKGGRRGPAFDIEVTDEITSTGYAIITSSAHNELSQESEELRGAFFTHYLVSALRGEGDETDDGKVTLSEAYQYAYTRTLARTSSTVGGSQHPMYHFRLEGRGEIILTRTDRTGSNIAVTLPEDGRLVLLDGGGEAIVAEALISPDGPAYFSVQPGRYLLYLVTPDGAVREARATVSSGSATSLSTNDFETTQLETGIAKGGLFLTSDEPFVHRVGGSGLWRLWPLQGAEASYGAQLYYRLTTPERWQPTLRATWATRSDVGISTGYHDVGLYGGMGRVKPIKWILLRAELMVGYEHILQSKRDGNARHTSGFDYLGALGLEIPFGTAFFSLEAGAGGRVFQVIGEGWVHRFDFQAALGLGIAWEAR